MVKNNKQQTRKAKPSGIWIRENDDTFRRMTEEEIKLCSDHNKKEKNKPYIYRPSFENAV